MPRIFTSERQTAIWSVAKEYGYTNLKEFWEGARQEGWDYYDVLALASP